MSANFDNDRAEADLARTNLGYREAKKQLKIAIRQSKATCWKELIASVESDPFLKPYKLVMRKLRGPLAKATMELQTLQAVIRTLFPINQTSTDRPPPRFGLPVPFTL